MTALRPISVPIAPPYPYFIPGDSLIVTDHVRGDILWVVFVQAEPPSE